MRDCSRQTYVHPDGGWLCHSIKRTRAHKKKGDNDLQCAKSRNLLQQTGGEVTAGDGAEERQLTAEPRAAMRCVDADRPAGQIQCRLIVELQLERLLFTGLKLTRYRLTVFLLYCNRSENERKCCFFIFRPENKTTRDKKKHILPKYKQHIKNDPPFFHIYQCSQGRRMRTHHEHEDRKKNQNKL